MKKILLVVDMQNDFINGTLGSKDAEAIVEKVVDKVKSYENEESLIIYTKDTHFENYLETEEGKKLPVKHCVKDTNGWEIPSVILRDNKNIIEKYTFGSVDLFNELNKIEEKIESIELIGLCTDICVVSNALLAKAYFPNKKIMVDEKCCAGVTKESHKNAIETMKMCQIEILN